MTPLPIITDFKREHLCFALILNMYRLIKAIFRSWSDPKFHGSLLLAVLLLLSGTLFYRSVEGLSWVDALYFSATIVSTVGLGGFAPQTDLGKIFAVVYVFVGVGVFVALFAQFAKALLRDLE